jgi:hypothetical protein
LADTGARGADEAWRAVMRDKSLQFQFPDATPQAPPPGWLMRLGAFLARHAREIEIGAWVLLAILVLVAIYFLVRWLMRRGRVTAAAPPAQSLRAWQPTAKEALLLLADADALAAAGRFADAVHLLLLVAIQEIGQRHPGLVAPALTSREIAGLAALSPLARRIFSIIALVVERSRFGNRPMGPAEYAQCRAAFEQFTQVDVWRAAA